MTAFQVRTFVPRDGNLSITLPVRFRGKKVKLSAEPEKQDEEEKDAFTLFCENFRASDYSSMSDEEYLEGIRSLRGILTGPVDYSDLREETDRSRKIRQEEHIAWMERFCGSIQNVDYSDLRDETDREL